MNEFVARIRWGNLARIGAVLAAVGLIVAWPKLKSGPPALPPAATVPEIQPSAPLVATPPATTEEPSAATLPEEPAATEPEKKPNRKKRKKRERPQPSQAATRPAPVSPPAPVVPARPLPAPEFQAFG